jgi:hypothetical protein
LEKELSGKVKDEKFKLINLIFKKNREFVARIKESTIKDNEEK